jgi:hypothetical protein
MVTMDKMKDRRVLLSTTAKAKLDAYIGSQREKNAGVPGYMTSRNAVVSDIVIKFIEGSPMVQETISLASNTN